MQPMRWLLSLLALLLLGACSSLSLGYHQLPRLAGWWIDGYLDLDREQRRQLDAGLAQMMTWHRREELPRWQALLGEADALWHKGPPDEAALLRLERAAYASMERTLAQAAPLAAPLLASLRPAQWQRLERRQTERMNEWLEAQRKLVRDGDLAEERGKRFAKQLERWLGRLETPLRRQAVDAVRDWPADTEASVKAWAARQQLTRQGLRAWAAGELEEGRRLLVQASVPLPERLSEFERARRAMVMSTVLDLLAAAPPAQQARARAKWQQWRQDLVALEGSR